MADVRGDKSQTEPVDTEANIRRAWYDKARVGLNTYKGMTEAKWANIVEMMASDLVSLYRAYIQTYEAAYFASPRTAGTLRLFVVVVEKGERTAVYGVYDESAEAAEKVVLGKNTGWRVVKTEPVERAKSMLLHRDQFEPDFEPGETRAPVTTGTRPASAPECSCPETTGGPFGVAGPMCMRPAAPPSGCRKRALAQAQALMSAPRSAVTSSTPPPWTDAAEAAFEKWWQQWRAANSYPNTERMRDAARHVYTSIAYGATDTMVEQLRDAGFAPRSTGTHTSTKEK